MEWIKFKVYEHIEAAYCIIDNNPLNVTIKLLTKVPKKYYYQFLNDAGHMFDTEILPTLK